jgi:ribosome maturation factor RimP
VEDCEKVTRQLQFALEVDAVEYRRLEVSSPGIDRPLRHEQDFERFVGQVIDVTLKAPIGAAAAGQVNANRKKFRGVLERTGAGGWRWPLMLRRNRVGKSSGVTSRWSSRVPRSARRSLPAPLQALGFALD